MMGYRRATPVECVSPNFVTALRRPIELEARNSKFASHIAVGQAGQQPHLIDRDRRNDFPMP